MMAEMEKEEMKNEDRVEPSIAFDGEEHNGAASNAIPAFQARGRKKSHLLTFALAMILTWGLGTYAYIYFYPHFFYNKLERVIVQRGIGAITTGGSSSGIPINTLFAMPDLASPATSTSNLMVTGTNHDTLYPVGWLDLSIGPQVLHVPDLADRYYSIEFVDPWGDVIAYVGRRTTGTHAGDYLISGPGWRGVLPEGVTQIISPNNSVLLIGRVLVENDSDVATAYGLEKQIQLTLLSHWHPGQ
jgi:hypothetical protein